MMTPKTKGFIRTNFHLFFHNAIAESGNDKRSTNKDTHANGAENV